VWTSYELATFFENNRDQPLWSPPEALFNYSNLGMSLQLIFWRDGDSGPARYVSPLRGVGVRTTD